MPRRRNPKIEQLEIRIRADFKRALKEIAEYERISMASYIIRATAYRMELAGIGPPAEEKAGGREDYLQMTRSQRQSKAKGATTPPGEDKPAAKRPTCITDGKTGRSIGGRRGGRPIGDPRRLTGRFIP